MSYGSNATSSSHSIVSIPKVPITSTPLKFPSSHPMPIILFHFGSINCSIHKTLIRINSTSNCYICEFLYKLKTKYQNWWRKRNPDKEEKGKILTEEFALVSEIVVSLRLRNCWGDDHEHHEAQNRYSPCVNGAFLHFHAALHCTATDLICYCFCYFCKNGVYGSGWIGLDFFLW